MLKKLHQVRHPESGRLMVEVSLSGPESWVRSFARDDHGRFWDASAEGGVVQVGPEVSGRRPDATLVCPAHGYLLAEAHLAAGETTIVVGFCRKCRSKYTLARIVTEGGDVVVAPTLLHERQLRSASPTGILAEARRALTS